jgi:hypothetical protein
MIAAFVNWLANKQNGRMYSFGASAGSMPAHWTPDTLFIPFEQALHPDWVQRPCYLEAMSAPT